MKKTLAKAIALTAAFSLITVNAVFAGGAIGHGDISILNDQGQVATKLAGQNPIEDGALLVCDGKCMLKSQGISIIADDKSKIAVKNETDIFKLYVKEGQVDYVINSNARKIAFITPQGTHTIAEAIFSASTGSVVKGSVRVTEEGETQIAVSEGRLVFTTAEGVQTVDANNGLILAQAPAGATFAFPSIFGLGAVASAIVAAGFTIVVIGGIAYVVDDDDDDPPASP